MFTAKTFLKYSKRRNIELLFPKNIIKSLPPNNDKFLEKVKQGFNHYTNYKKFNTLTQENNRYYEFGAGRTLTIPLTMSFLDFEVSCVDIRKLIIPTLVNDSLNKFQLNKNKLPFNLKTEIVVNNKNKYTKQLDG